MSICAEGDLGVPNATAAMGEGMAWMNVQVAPPWDTDNTTVQEAAAAVKRRLLAEDGEKSTVAAKKDCKKAENKKSCSNDKLQGGIFAWGVLLIGVLFRAPCAVPF